MSRSAGKPGPFRRIAVALAVVAAIAAAGWYWMGRAPDASAGFRTGTVCPGPCPTTDQVSVRNSRRRRMAVLSGVALKSPQRMTGVAPAAATIRRSSSAL